MKKASEILTFYFEVIKNSQEVAKKKKKRTKRSRGPNPQLPPVLILLPNYSALSKPGRLIDTMQLTGP